MKLLAVGVETWTDVNWMSDVGPVPGSITKQDTIAAWLVKERAKREADGYKSVWMGRIRRMVFADATASFASQPLNIVFDTADSTESPAIAAYKWLLESAGAEISPTAGCTSHLMFGWQFKKSIRAWGGDLMLNIIHGGLQLAGGGPLPLRFWHRPPRAKSVKDIFLSATDATWVSESDLSRVLGFPVDISAADCLAQLAVLRGLANIADYPMDYVNNPTDYYEDPYQFQ